ncbi:class I SAM-dependent methyltransferase [Aureibacillus halotolerans]|uniref:Methyltransferase family protein n=1 Tax=Aureibacillus halotolerans TaxID=1508390 RepID=A0A4R6U1S9_9BACI|nr:class I SAM-dependent methyltransferase [Aureibacillus halotolerans]TDQ38389.1 methyltransferase family protein [Aureibacillus halotolerans]
MNHDQVRATFGKHASSYVTSEVHAKGEDLTWLADLLKLTGSETALDVATGGGHTARVLADSGANVTAVDLTPEMLDAAREHLGERDNVQYKVADAQALPFADETFDVVTCRIAAHHFPEPSTFVREVHRVLRSGGRFLLIDNIVPENEPLADWINETETIRDPGHARCLSISEWNELFADAGLTLQHDSAWKKQMVFEPWVNRILDDETIIESITQRFLQATPAVKKGFEIQVENGQPTQFALFAWMVLGKKS